MATVHSIQLKSNTPGERGVPKLPVSQAEVTMEGVAGDFNHYRHEAKNDSPHRGLLVFPLEMIQALNDEGWPIEPGHLGENITSVGIPYEEMRLGNRYRIGEVEFELTEEATPCRNLYVLPYVGIERGPELIKTLHNRRGWYAQVSSEGVIALGDEIESLSS